jgi:hypothetical protein
MYEYIFQDFKLSVYFHYSIVHFMIIGMFMW